MKYPQERRTFVPSGELTRTGLVNLVRPNGKRAVHTVSTARPISTARSVSTVRPFASNIAQTGSAIRPIYPRMDNVRPRALYSPIKRSYYTKPTFRSKKLKQDVKTSGVKNITDVGTKAVVNTGKGKMDNDLKNSRWVWRPKGNYMDHESKEKGSFILKKFKAIQKAFYKIRHHFIRDCYMLSRFTLMPMGGKSVDYFVKLCTAGTKVNTARLSLCCSKYFTMEMMFGLGKFGAARQIRCCKAYLVLPGKFGAARQIWGCQAYLVLSGKFGAARKIWCC
ncbi:hypothetical protein Tco_1528939 [Tanacetum coccineum]